MDSYTAVTLVDSTERRVSEAFHAWMATLPANTAAAYRGSWAALQQHSAHIPTEITRADVALWVESLKRLGYSGATINMRLAGISSFYAYLRDCFGIVLENPAQGKTLRQRVHRWEGARFLDPEGVTALLSAIDRSTVKGSRDYALLITYVFTGRRNTEIRKLRWGDIEASGGETWYRWSGKGKSRRDQMPQPVIDAIRDYLRISKRDVSIKPTDFIFISSVRAQTSKPISANQVRRLLSKHIKAAGFTVHIRVHDLRHTAAMLYKAAGEDIESIQVILDHSNVNTTAIYLHALEGHATRAWRGVEALLGLKGEVFCVHETRIASENAKSNSDMNLAGMRTQTVTIREESLCQNRGNGQIRQPLRGTAALSAQ